MAKGSGVWSDKGIVEKLVGEWTVEIKYDRSGDSKSEETGDLKGEGSGDWSSEGSGYRSGEG